LYALCIVLATELSAYMDNLIFSFSLVAGAHRFKMRRNGVSGIRTLLYCHVKLRVCLVCKTVSTGQNSTR